MRPPEPGGVDREAHGGGHSAGRRAGDRCVATPTRPPTTSKRGARCDPAPERRPRSWLPGRSAAAASARAPRRSTRCARRRCRAAGSSDRARGSGAAGGGPPAASVAGQLRPASSSFFKHRGQDVAHRLARRTARRPVSISNSTTPKAQMSARLSTGFPRACSGACRPRCRGSRRPAVPVRARVGDCDRSGREPEDASLAYALARPKSRTLTLPSGVSLTFAGFRSRWTMPLLVRLLERLGDLPRDRERLVDRDPPPLQARRPGPRPGRAPWRGSGRASRQRAWRSRSRRRGRCWGD